MSVSAVRTSTRNSPKSHATNSSEFSSGDGVPGTMPLYARIEGGRLVSMCKVSGAF
jgi:hypothetical protein